jgi:hypothetical protein
VPIELVPTFNIAAGNNQSIWTDIYIPKTATAGLYSGAVTVSENGVATYTVPVQLNVRNFSLPDTPNSKTMLYVGAYDVSRRYGSATQLQALTNQMLVTHRHKISLIDDNMNIGWGQTAPAAQWISFLNGSAFVAANGYAGPGALTSNNVFSIGTYGIMTAGVTQNAFTAMLNAWETWFARNSPSTERFVYLCDEVACQNSTPALTTQLGWWSAITGAGRNLHTLATRPLLNVAQSALSNPTSGWPYSQGIYPARTNGYTSVDQSAANSVKAKEPFRRLFAYGSTRPGEGSFATEDQGTSPRELAWAQYKKNIDRWFVWNANYYTNYQGGLGDTDVFTTARTFGGQHWRRGIQDVDYIVLANSLNAQAVSALVQQMVFEHVELAIAILVDPLPDRVTLDGRLDVRRPVPSVGEDAAQGGIVGDQHVGCTRRYHKFQWPKRDHHERHSGAAAQHVLSAVAKAALLLIRDAGVQDGLVFGRQRRLLPVPPRLCLVERGLARKPGHDEPVPLPSEVGYCE